MIFFRLLSRLPFWFLYGVADFLYFLLFYVVRYRRTVVLENLRLSFPEKSPDAIYLIAKGFYRNLADIFVEILKLPSLSLDEMQKRVLFTNAALVRDRVRAGQSIIGMGSHQGNWEWIPSALAANQVPVDSIYKPLTSPFFEELMRHIRSSFGAIPVPMHTLPRHMAAHKNIPRVIGLVSDQVPDVPEQAYWTDFLHRDTPFYPGSERLARSRKLPIFYFDLVRLRRGYYQLTLIPVAEPPYDELPLGAIMDRYRDLLEATIQKHPSDWLWSHKRWKHWRGKYARIDVKLQ